MTVWKLNNEESVYVIITYDVISAITVNEPVRNKYHHVQSYIFLTVLLPFYLLFLTAFCYYAYLWIKKNLVKRGVQDKLCDFELIVFTFTLESITIVWNLKTWNVAMIYIYIYEIRRTVVIMYRIEMSYLTKSLQLSYLTAIICVFR